MEEHLENHNLEDREEDGMTLSRWLSGRQVVRIGNGWNWLGIISNDGL
jgi:hypothetical protein